MNTPPIYRDPLASAVERIALLERENADLRAVRAPHGARTRRIAGLVFLGILVTSAPAIAFVLATMRAEKQALPVAKETPATTYSGTYRLTPWRPGADGNQSGPMVLTLERDTGKLRGHMTGPIGSARIMGQVTDPQKSFQAVIVFDESSQRSMVYGNVLGDAVQGSFPVPSASSSAWFALEAPATPPR